MRVLVLCRANSCRSQIAEGYLKFYARNELNVVSAGLESSILNSLAVKVMQEDGIDISDHYSKSYRSLQNEYFDFLITVCQTNPTVLTQFIHFDRHIHFDIEDPTQFEGTSEEKMALFRSTRENIKGCMLKFIGTWIHLNHMAA